MLQEGDMRRSEEELSDTIRMGMSAAELMVAVSCVAELSQSYDRS